MSGTSPHPPQGIAGNNGVGVWGGVRGLLLGGGVEGRVDGKVGGWLSVDCWLGRQQTTDSLGFCCLLAGWWLGGEGAIDFDK